MPNSKKTIRRPKSRPPEIPSEAKPVNYIDINEHATEINTKNQLLMVIAGVAAIILVAGWLFALQMNLKKGGNPLDLNQFYEQLSSSIGKFDTAMGETSSTQPLNPADLQAVETNVEQQIKNNSSSTAWSLHYLSTINLSLRYPDTWQQKLAGKTVILSDYDLGSATPTNFGRISLTVKTNASHLNLKDWLAKNKIDLTGLMQQQPLFVFSTTSAEALIYTANATSGSPIVERYYLNANGNKAVYEITVDAAGDANYYQPLIENILKTITLD